MVGGLALPGAGRGAEIVPFRLVQVGGAAELRYDYDKESSATSGALDSTRTQHQFTEGVEVNTLSYIYHPNLLKLSAGAGFALYQDESRSNGDRGGGDERLTKLDLRASILEKKPYPLALFYNRDNTTNSPVLGERYVQTGTRFGLNFALHQPFSPVGLTMDAYREQQIGSGETQVTDSVQDVLSLQGLKNYGDEQYVQGAYRWTRQQSSSGVLSAPIESSKDLAHSYSLGTGNTFGSDQQFALTSSASYTTQSGTTNRDEMSFIPNLRWNYSEALDAFAQYSLSTSETFSATQQGNIKTQRQTATTGVNYRVSEELLSNGRLRWNDSRATGVNDRSYSGEAQLNYRGEHGPVGLIVASSATYELQDRVSSSSQAEVIGESVTLIGLTPVVLANPFVDVTKVVVSNETRTQTYVENFDYRLVTVGSLTTIERVPTGNIQDGEVVLVDYEYLTGGTFGTANLGYSLSANASAFEYYSVFANYFRQHINLTSGDPEIPLNPTRTIRYGAAIANYPLPMYVRGDMRLEFQHHREEISPSDSINFEASVNAPFGRRTQVYLSYRRSMVDNLLSDEDTDLTGYHLTVRSRPLRTLGLSAEVSNQKDTGGTQLRNTWLAQLRAEWRLYRLQVLGVGDYALEEQGPLERNGYSFNLQVRREF